MKPVDYSYQRGLVNRVLTAFKDGHTKVVLAAAPGAGKTRMASDVIYAMNKRTMILAHGQNIIREQWATQEWSRTPAVLRAGFEDGDLKKDFVITLPQTIIHKLEGELFDLLVVDEAHERYFANQVTAIREMISPKYELLLTGTPYEFVGNDEFHVIGITAQELLEYGVISDPHIKLISSPYRLTYADYNRELMLNKNKTFSVEDTQKTVRAAIDYLQKENGKIGKTMIVCHNQLQAADTHSWLTDKNQSSILSVSDVSCGTEELHEFKNSDKKFFIVVDRGILGFDYPDLENVIDMSATLNPFTLFQMLCRVVRNNGKKKSFIKVADKDTGAAANVIMNFTVCLSNAKYYYSTFSKYHTEIPVPRDVDHLGFDMESAEVFRFKDVKNVELLSKTTLSRAMGKLSMNRYDLMSVIDIAKTCISRAEFRNKHKKLYSFLSRNSYLHFLDAVHPAPVVVDWRAMTKRERLKKAREIQAKHGYKSMYQFRLKNSALYKNLSKDGSLDKVGIKIQSKWTMESALATANKYKSSRELRMAHAGCESFLRVNGVSMGDLFGTTEYSKRWTVDDLKKLAIKFKNMRSFREAYPGGYKFLLKKKATHLMVFTRRKREPKSKRNRK